MNHRNYLEGNVANVYDNSFQINSGLYADQSQLNELDIDFDAFDEATPQGDPFATPLPKSRDISFVVKDLTHCPIILYASQPTSPPKASASGNRAEPLDTPCINNPLLHVFKQPVSDDFFDVRKRNGNIFNGLDLTSKSTARLWKDKDKKLTPEEFEAVVQSKLSAPCPIVSSAADPSVSTPVMELDPPIVEEAALPLEVKPEQRHPEIVKDAKVTKNKPVKPKPILRNSKSTVSSISTRVMKPTTKPLKQKKQEPREDAEHKDRRQSSGSLASLGGGLIDVLMSYGEKLRNSFGKEPESPLPLGNKQCDAAEDTVQSDPPPEIPTEIKQEGLSTQEYSNPPLPVISGNPSQGNEDNTLNIAQIDPMRTSKKRLLPISPGRERKKRCIQDENINVSRPNMNSTIDGKALSVNGRTEKPISRPRPLGASKAININRAIDDRGNDRLKTSHTLGASRSGKASIIGGFSRRNGSARPASSSISGPSSGPMFASDVYRQLAVEKAQKEQQSNTTAFSKPVPPARPALRPTIPAAFVFRSEERIAQRHAETNEKLKGAEDHLATSVVPVASVKTTTTATAQANRKTSNPILPTDAPALNTLIRAKAREKFDAERKEREKILELQRLIRERERAEQEEREYREARKRTIPRAHEVPEWYKDASHRRKELE